MNKKFIGSIIRITVSFGFMALLFFLMRDKLGDILKILLNVDYLLLTVALILFSSGVIFISTRLKLFLAAQKIYVTMKETIGLTLIGYFFNNFLPTAVGGDVVKAYYASKKTSGKLDSFTSVFMDRFIGCLAIISFALFASLLLGEELRNQFIIWPMWILFFAAILFLLALFNTKAISKIYSFKIFNWIEKIHVSLKSLKNKKRLFSKAYLISLCGQFFAFLAVYIIIRALGDSVAFMKIVLIMPVVVIVSMLPSINGLGVREGAFLLLFKPFIGAERAVALSLIWLFMYIVIGIFGGLVYAFAKHEKREIQ